MKNKIRSNAIVATLLLLPGLSATVYACTGATGCDGTALGPQGVSWNADNCQNVGSGGFAWTCNGHNNNLTSGWSIKRIYYPTRVCAVGEPNCVNIANHFVCWEEWIYNAPNCTGGDVLAYSKCMKDGACAGTTTPPSTE